jgi:glycine cleavage system aminomethyltransferase T
MGLGRLVNLDKQRFVGQQTLVRESKHAPAKQIVGLRSIGTKSSDNTKFWDCHRPSRQLHRVAVPVFRNDKQIGKATSAT